MADQTWIITTAVGTGEKGFAGDGGPAERRCSTGRSTSCFDRAGNLYFSDTFNNRIRRVDAAQRDHHHGRRQWRQGYSGDGGPATAAALNEPYGVVVDRAGNLYIADRLNRRVRRIDGAIGRHHDLAGTGEAGYSGDGGPAAQRRAGRAERAGLRAGRDAALTSPMSPTTGCASSISRAARSPPSPAPARPSIRGDGGPATAAGTFGARAVKVAADGTVYILERQGSSLRAVDPKTGIITTIAGTTARGYAGDGGPALAAVFDAPKEMAIDRDGDC